MEDEKNTKEFEIIPDKINNIIDEGAKTQIFSPLESQSKKEKIKGKIGKFSSRAWEKITDFSRKFAVSVLYGASAFTAATIIFCLFLSLASGITLTVLSLVFGTIYITGFLMLGLFEIGASIFFLGFSLLFFTLFWEAAKIYIPFFKSDMKFALKEAFSKQRRVKIYE